MVVLLHFLTGTEGRIISPRPDLWPKTQKWVPTFQSQSIELYAETCTHTNAHTNTVYTRAVWLECCSAPNRNVIAEEASQSRERPLRQKSQWQAGAERPPLEGD
jgi:hypothetical protein